MKKESLYSVSNYLEVEQQRLRHYPEKLKMRKAKKISFIN